MIERIRNPRFDSNHRVNIVENVKDRKAGRNMCLDIETHNATDKAKYFLYASDEEILFDTFEVYL